MATFQQKKDRTYDRAVDYPPNRNTLAERVRMLEGQKTLAERGEITSRETKEFKWPFKWTRRLRKANKQRKDDSMLVVYFNKKNQIEPPRFMPIFDGNMVVWKNKPYEFDPRAIWTMLGVRGLPRVYCIREIDRRPIKNPDGSFKRDRHGRVIYSSDAAISNNDIDEVRARGDSTESDEFLIKAALKAQSSQVRKNINVVAIAVVAIIVIGGLIWFLASGS